MWPFEKSFTSFGVQTERNIPRHANTGSHDELVIKTNHTVKEINGIVDLNLVKIILTQWPSEFPKLAVCLVCMRICDSILIAAWVGDKIASPASEIVRKNPVSSSKLDRILSSDLPCDRSALRGISLSIVWKVAIKSVPFRAGTEFGIELKR